MPEWKIAESTIKPDLLIYEPNNLLVIRNIEEYEKEDMTYYSYEYARMTAQEYVNYSLDKRLTDAEDIILDMSEEIYK